MSGRKAPSLRSPSTVERRDEVMVSFNDVKYIESLEKRQKLARLCQDLKTELYSMDATAKQSLPGTFDVTIFDEFKENCNMFSASELELQLALAECRNEVHLDLDSDEDKEDKNTLQSISRDNANWNTK